MSGITPHWEATLERTLGRSLLQKPKNNQLHDESKGRKPYFRIILEDFRFGIYLTLSLKNIGRTRWPVKLPDICKLHVVKIYTQLVHQAYLEPKFRTMHDSFSAHLTPELGHKKRFIFI